MRMNRYFFKPDLIGRVCCTIEFYLRPLENYYLCQHSNGYYYAQSFWIGGDGFRPYF